MEFTLRTLGTIPSLFSFSPALKVLSAVAVASLVSAPVMRADNPHVDDPVVVMTNPDVSYGAGSTSITVHGMRKGQAAGPSDAKPLHILQGNSRTKGGGGGGGGSTDPALQSTVYSSLGSISNILNFEGQGNGFAGFSVDSAPPDTNGAAGATQYVQWVNESFAVFNKADGSTAEGPIPGNELFQSLGKTHPCAVNNDGDPIAQYDKANKRWIMTQFSITNGASVGYWQCIAISQSSDATGAYNVYAFREPYFNDYPKVGVYNGVYYMTYNMFRGNTFVGARLCAYNAAAMRAGTTAAEQCFQLSSAYGGVLPADVDGLTQPPAGNSEYFIAFGTNSLLTWRFHVDFTNSANSTLTGPYTTSVDTFAEACGGVTCIPQPGTSQALDSLGDRLMYRLSYRHFADGHEALFVNHSVNPGAVASGSRWYELRPTSGDATGVSVYQQSTYAPSDGLSRWMGSIASDKAGNLALGYSTSSSSAYPAIRYSYRIPTDTLNRIGSEQLLWQGTGSQTSGLNRWGDYSAMSVDPVDDCTFWYTNEYLPSNGSFNWHTRIGSFKLNGCN